MIPMPTEEERSAAGLYDKLGHHYHDLRTARHRGGWFFNELLEMPATLELMGDVKGRKILDFGCGSGIWAGLLQSRGRG